MPILTRYNNSSKRRGCIEDETPVAPKKGKKVGNIIMTEQNAEVSTFERSS